MKIESNILFNYIRARIEEIYLGSSKKHFCRTYELRLFRMFLKKLEQQQKTKIYSFRIKKTINDKDMMISGVLFAFDFDEAWGKIIKGFNIKVTQTHEQVLCYKMNNDAVDISVSKPPSVFQKELKNKFN